MKQPIAAQALVIVSNEQTPYRLHFHRRITREIPELQLWSVFTHERASSPWQYKDHAEINSLLFGTGHSTQERSGFHNVLREWKKGGDILKWMGGINIAAVVVLGYNDAGRLRILAWSRRNRIPCLLFGDSNILGDENKAWKAWIKKKFLQQILGRCSGVLCCGRLGQQYFRRYGVPLEQIAFMPYEPDYDLLQSVDDAGVNRVAAKHRLQPSKRYFLYSGRLEKIKRVDLLLRAFEQVAPERQAWDLIIAGDGSRRRELEASVSPLFRHRVIWTGFIANYDTLAAIYRLADVLVIPSDYEPWGVVVSEAVTRMAIVASSVVGAANELVRDGVNGKIFRRGDVHSLTSALCEVTDAARIESMKQASPGILAEWRRAADPVIGLRQALGRAGALKTSLFSCHM